MTREIDVPRVRGDAIDRLARAIYAARNPNGDYAALSFWQQSWFWDRARTELQAQGLRVQCHATWQCPPPPAHLPTDSLDELRARVRAAKLALPASPHGQAELIVHAEGVLRDFICWQTLYECCCGGGGTDILRARFSTAKLGLSAGPFGDFAELIACADDTLAGLLDRQASLYCGSGCQCGGWR